MFGRNPRLLVNMMFEAVLRDQDLVNYEEYVTSLVRDLKEAMAMAQDSTCKQQKKHAALYNCKLKGTPV